MIKQRSITAKERAFAERILAGDSPSAAYISAGYAKSNSNVMAVAAHKIGHRPEVLAYVDAGRARLASRSVLTRERKLERLAELVQDGKRVSRDGLKALEIHNLMTGDNAPQQVNVFGLSDLLTIVRKGNRPTE